MEHAGNSMQFSMHFKYQPHSLNLIRFSFHLTFNLYLELCNLFNVVNLLRV